MATDISLIQILFGIVLGHFTGYNYAIYKLKGHVEVLGIKFTNKHFYVEEGHNESRNDREHY